MGFEFTGWLGQTISDVIDLFKEKFLASWENHVTDCLAIEEGFNTAASKAFLSPDSREGEDWHENLFGKDK